MVAVFWNARGIRNKEGALKSFLGAQGATYAGISESHTYKAAELTDGKWRWDAGAEGKPPRPAGGLGAFIDTTTCKGSVVKVGKYVLWHRVELGQVKAAAHAHSALYLGVCYFPQSTDTKGHKAANAEVAADMLHFKALGHVAVGGDMNAHTKSNHDEQPWDEAGRMLVATLEETGMLLVNSWGRVCTGGPSRVQVQKDGVQASTLDYFVCSPSLAPHIKSLAIVDHAMESDHRPLVVTLTGLQAATPALPARREVWRIENIPADSRKDFSWVAACRDRMGRWIDEAKGIEEELDAIGADTTLMADVLEWSFQSAIDEVAQAQLGTRVPRPRRTPGLTAASKLLVQQRMICEDTLKRLMANGKTPQPELTRARTQFLDASRAVRKASERTRELEELRLFRDVEANQADSKVFWGRFKRLRNSIRVTKSPPPVATDKDGRTVTDPLEVLCIWKDFSASIAAKDLCGTTEEGIYDNEYQRETEERLEWYRSMRNHQPILDDPILESEVWAAIRKLRVGKAPGEDGVLTDILKSAADAVGKGKLKPGNTFVTALTRLFNFVFEREVWPERWGSGVIFPLHKQDSRLDPANYRPITLMSAMGKLFGSVVNARLSAFSERTGTISDEQGGFRPKRGTPDQVFLFREILASRKERKLPTYATYIDAKKAYDTVWREDAYVRIYESGVRGRLWRQLQAMHAGLTRKVRHPLGLTDSFPVGRGVAQGAVESPWVYSNFIEGLAQALKAAGHGIYIAGRRVPLLMYADDVVMLAGSAEELMAMNSVATTFAHQHRFQYNGGKSGVMVFNVPQATRDQARSMPWTLFGENVEVKDEYEYLGTITTNDDIGWKQHFEKVMAAAERRTRDLLWICRYDNGMRPRTAVSLWQAMVRPMLEYASEVWAGQVSTKMMADAEALQMRFLRGTLGLDPKGKGGVSDDAVRAETGCEPLEQRWSKLKLGYWRRIFMSPPDRLLRVVAEFRHAEHVASGGHGLGGRGFMSTAKAALTDHGLQDYWDDPLLATTISAGMWKKVTYDAVEEAGDDTRHNRMIQLPSTFDYAHVKEWGRNTSDYAALSSEVDWLSQRPAGALPR